MKEKGTKNNSKEIIPIHVFLFINEKKNIEI